jgi:hypothetical protein
MQSDAGSPAIVPSASDGSGMKPVRALSSIANSATTAAVSRQLLGGADIAVRLCVLGSPAIATMDRPCGTALTPAQRGTGITRPPCDMTSQSAPLRHSAQDSSRKYPRAEMALLECSIRQASGAAAVHPASHTGRPCPDVGQGLTVNA